jgi:hypothetical protein
VRCCFHLLFVIVRDPPPGAVFYCYFYFFTNKSTWAVACDSELLSPRMLSVGSCSLTSTPNDEGAVEGRDDSVVARFDEWISRLFSCGCCDTYGALLRPSVPAETGLEGGPHAESRRGGHNTVSRISGSLLLQSTFSYGLTS